MTTANPYLRKSSADAGKSVAAQEKEILEDLADEGIEVGETFSDPQTSASRFRRKDPADFARLLAHIESGKCEMLAMWESSRGSRDPEVWFPLLAACRRHHTLIRITTHGRTYDMAKRRDWKTLADEGVNSADESELKSERTLRGKRTAAAAGKPAGQLLFGYRRQYDERGHYIEQLEDPERAPFVREVFQRIAKHDAINTIVRDLNARKAPAPGRYGDSLWCPDYVRRVVRNPGYLGKRVHQGKVVGSAAWPALVDEFTWRAANAVLNDPARRITRGTDLQYLLSGVARCGDPDCPGLPAVTAKRGRRAQPARPGRLISRGRDRYGIRRYACEVCTRSSLFADEFDDFVERQVRERLARPDAHTLFVPRNDDEALDAVKATVAELTDRMQEHYKEAAAGRLSAPGLAAMEALLLPEIAATEERVRVLSTPPTLAALAGVDVGKKWGELSVRQRREVVRALCDIVVCPVPGARGFDSQRLAESRWIGDPLTWGEHWTAEA